MRQVAIGLAVLVCAGTAEAGTSVTVPAFWQRVAQCETGGRWDWGKYAGSASRRPGEGTRFEGGVGFYYGTWELWAGQLHVRFQHAWQAPPAVQVRVATWGLEHGGYWGCLHDGRVDPSGAPTFASLIRTARRKEAPHRPRGLDRLVRLFATV